MKINSIFLAGIIFVCLFLYSSAAWAANGAQFIGQSVPATMSAGQTYSVSVTMKNTGTAAWTETTKYRLGVQNPHDNGTWMTGRVFLPVNESIAPGQSKTFTFNVVAPISSGTYNFQWQMVQDNVAWFGDKSANAVISVVRPKSPLMEIMKKKGCVWEGLLSFGDPNTLVPLLNRSGCQYLHRALASWPYPPDFNKATNIMARVTKQNMIYGMDVAEAVNTSVLNYYYPDENRNFNFAGMCKPGTNQSSAWGVFCTPTLSKIEFQKYVLYTVKKGIDIGIQDIEFAQPYLYDDVSSPVLPSIISQLRWYAQSKGKDVVIGGQTNSVSDENYLRKFDYIWGGVAQDYSGNIEDIDCSAKWPGMCWALLWRPTWANKANDVLLHLDWYGSTNDDNAKYLKFSRDLRASFLAKMYTFFRSKNMGFILPYFVPNTAGTAGCSGQSLIYTPDLCQDEEAINGILGATISKSNAQFVSHSVPSTMVAGQVYPVSVTVKNIGTSTWTESGNYRLGSQNPQDNLDWGTRRASLSSGDSIAPGQSKTFVFNVTAPSVAGTHSFQWQMLREGVEWFGDKSLNAAVNVASGVQAKIACLGDSITYGIGVDNPTVNSFCAKIGKKGNFAIDNEGISGDISTGVLNRVSSVTGKGYYASTLLIGTNDMNQGLPSFTDIPTYYRNVSAIVDKLKQDGQKVVLSTIPPCNDTVYRHCQPGNQTNVIERNKVIRKISSEKGVCYADIFSGVFNSNYSASLFVDGVHPNAVAHAAIADNFLSAMNVCNPFDCANHPADCYSIPTTAVSGQVTDNSGRRLAGITILLCNNNGSVVTDAAGRWSKTLSTGTSYCARIDSSSLSVGWTSIKTNNNSCHSGGQTYEFQSVGQNKFQSCAAANEGSWDMATDNNIDFIVNYPGQACVPSAVSGCKVCKLDGSGWEDIDAKCLAGQKCQGGSCVTAQKTVCSALTGYDGTLNDAAPVLQDCINNAPKNSIVELPVGKYTLAQTVWFDNPVTLRSQGKDSTMARCHYRQGDCAELIASPMFGKSAFWPSMLLMRADGSAIDHLVFDGNLVERKKNNITNLSTNVGLECANCSFTNNIVTAAYGVAGMGSMDERRDVGTLGAIVRDKVTVSRNLFAYNGIHGDYGNNNIADGFTGWDFSNSVFTENEFVDNTDVDFDMGGCRNCAIKNNIIRHSASYRQASFGALLIHAWPGKPYNNLGTSGNWTGTEISSNKIDCGANRRCTAGLIIGPHHWYPGITFGGVVHDNTVQNAYSGVIIDDATGFEVYNNKVAGSLGLGYSIGNKSVIGTSATNINTSKDTLGIKYATHDWDWNLKMNDPLNDNGVCKYNCSASENDAVFIAQSVPTEMAAGRTYTVSVTMKNMGATTWSKLDGYRLGYIDWDNQMLWGIHRIELANSTYIDPVDSNVKTFNFTVAAPKTTGTYNFQWQMLREGVEWFGQATPAVAVRINGADSTVCIPGNTSGCKVCKADGSGWAEDNSKCLSGVCRSGVCVEQSSVFNVPYSEINAMGCGSNANPAANNACGAHRWCASKGYTSGFQTEWGPTSASVVCVNGSALTVVYADLEKMNCGAATDNFMHQACRASRWCASKGYTSGFQTEWGPTSGAVVCVRGGALTVAYADLEKMNCGAATDNFMHQACRASRWCASKGYTSGFQTEWGPTSASVVCVDKKVVAATGKTADFIGNLQASLASIQSRVRALLSQFGR